MNSIQLFSSHIISRPRIDALLDTATRGKLVYVIAGAGYGKTQAVRGYIGQQHDAVIRWVQLTESDNVGSRYWEHLTYNISHDNPGLADRLREFGFPDTNARFKKFAEILKTSEHRSLKTFLILDDFHLIHSKQALRFAERCAHLNIPGACVIILTRTEPEINAISLFAKGQASVITEENLRFTDEEIAGYFKKRGIPLSAGTLSKLSGAAGGWGIAVSLLSMVLDKKPGDINTAIKLMKQNVFKLMEKEAFDSLTAATRKTLVKLSLISDLPHAALWEHFGDASFYQDAPQLAAFVWFDSLTGQDRVHPLYWEFLKSKQSILSEDEITDTYKKAALFCRENGYNIDGMKYLAASRQFGRMLDILLSYPFKLPIDMCRCFSDIINSIVPTAAERSDLNYLLLTNLFSPLLLLGEGLYEPACERCLENIRKWKRIKNPVAPLMLGIAYSNLAYIDMYACTVTHQYTAGKHLKKSLEYISKSTIAPLEITGAFAVADIRSFACPVGEGAALGEFDEFLDMAGETCRLVSNTSHNMYYGYDDLAACELAYYKNRQDIAKKYANEAVFKARKQNQHSIEAMAAMYLFRIAISEGDYPLVSELFRQRHDSPDTPYFWNRQYLYELGISFIYAQIGQTGMIPAWLVPGDNEPAFESSVPVRELICTARYYIATEKYSLALTLLSGAYPRVPHERFHLGELELTLLTAAARAGTGDIEGAARDFEQAYVLSIGGVFEMPFIEIGKDFTSLAAAAAKRGTGSIPPEWLKMTGRKASAYIKKAAVVLGSFKKEQHIEDTCHLSGRERDVLLDLYHGLTREEIAASRYLSVNTVHKIVQSVFLKLGAFNKADAIRTAVEKKLIETQA